MDIKSENINNDVLNVYLSGEMNKDTVSQFGKFFDNINELKIVLDMKDIQYISSAGLRSLVLLAKKVYAYNGEIIISNLTGLVKEIIEVSGFDELFKIFDTTDDAVSYFK